MITTARRWTVLLAALGPACGPAAPGAETGEDTAGETTGASTEQAPTTGASTPTGTGSPTTAATASSDFTSGPGDETGPVDTTTGEPAAFCVPGPSQPRRLSNAQYRNTLRDLLPGVTLPPLVFPANGRVEGFEHVAEANADSEAVTMAFAEAAAQVASAAAQQGGPWLPCTPDGGGDPAACGHAFVSDFTALALRRALTPEEQAQRLAEFDADLAQDGFEAALRRSLEVTLASEDFLHLRETAGSPVEGQPGVIQLDGFALAARMAYFLWDTTPDAALHELAAQGGLDTVEDVAERVALMQMDPRAIGGLTRFVRQWMYLHALEDGAELPPQVPAELRAPLRADVDDFVAHALHNGEGTIAALLTSPAGFLGEATAALYDVPPPPQEGAQVELDPARRPGLLTRVGWLALRSTGQRHSPFDRGRRIDDSLLCQQLPPPPPDVSATLPGDLPPDATTRQLYETITAEPQCAGCHLPPQMIGYGFEHYDLLGAWQDQENGHPVDASGEVLGRFGPDTVGPFVGAAELAGRLAGSRSVHDCVARKTFMYALGRMLTEPDRCDLDRLAAAFFAGGGRFADLQREIVLSDGFRHRLSP